MANVADHPDILADFFKLKNLNLLAWYGGSEVTTEICRYLKKNSNITKRPTIRQISEEAFRLLGNHYKIEYIYKNHLLKKPVFGRYSPKNTSLYFEFPVGNARADILVVNGRADIFEIKTQYDDYSNLENQVREYYRCFSNVTLLVHPSLVRTVSKIIPQYTGISTLSDSFKLSSARRVSSYFKNLNHEALFAILRAAERESVLISYGYKVPSVHPAELYDECLSLFRLFPIEDAYSNVINALQHRKPMSKYEDLCACLPQSLHTAAFSFSLRKKDWASLISRMDQPVRFINP